MAKTSMIERDRRRVRIAKQFAAKRAALKATVLSTTASAEEKWEAQIKLQKLPRDASPTRGRNRCAITGRSRGVYRRFGLARVKIREAVGRGELPGVSKASW